MKKGAPEDFTVSTGWLPDFCSPAQLFVIFLVTEVLVLVHALSVMNPHDDFLVSFSVTSLFAQLMALNLALLLCLARHLLNRLPVGAGVAFYSLLLIVVSWLYAQLAVWLNGTLQTPFGPDPGTQDAFILRTVIITWLAGLLLLRHFYIQRQWQKKVRQHAEARFMALQSRIKPHFLFNSMNSIASLIAIDPQQAEKAVENLAELFRYTLIEDSGYIVPLSHELNWVKKYLAMEKLRLGNRLQYEISITPTASTAHIPALSLQPLMENAITHGIQPRPEGGKISLTAYTEDNRLVIQIHNPLPRNVKEHTSGHGLALANIRERLSLLHGSKASLKTAVNNGFFETSMRLPLEPHHHDTRTKPIKRTNSR